MKFHSLLVSAIMLMPFSMVADDLLKAIPFEQVTLEDNFWRPRLIIQKETLVPFALDKVRPAMDNLRKTGQYLKGDKSELPFPHRFVASDLYKVMEGAAYLLTLEKDPALEHTMDSIIDLIGAAQKPDGYLYEAHTTGVSAQHEHWGGGGMGDRPYSWVVHSHELYNMGHMYEGAVAYYRATGKDKWLRIAEKSARHINHVFFEGDPAYNGGKPVMQAPGHEEIELALVKLYQSTGDTLYLNMAKRFIDIRGITFKPEVEGVLAPSYAQQHQPVREQRKAVGHAVRAAYLYSGMADVMAQTGDTSLRPALDSIWGNIVDTRMHITGGLGAIHGIEGFGPEYELPNLEAYDETCAAVGNVLFNYRMFMAEKDGKYIDVAEVALYNNVLAGVNLEGNRFFYVNPLEANGRRAFNQGLKGRAPWFGTACCPSNLARLIPQIPGMMYAHTDDDIYCTFYGGTSTTIPLGRGNIGIRQETGYPFDETVSLTVTPEKDSQKFALHLRIPTWAGDRFVPGKLYSYVNRQPDAWDVTVNGKKVKAKVDKGFAVIDRKWKKGDRVELHLPMGVMYNKATDKVEADRGRLCITRGPLVYCAEDVDNVSAPASYVISPAGDSAVIRKGDGLMKDIDFITVPARSIQNHGDTKLTLVPYYAWNNRTDGAMIVWLAATDEVAHAAMPSMPDYIADITATYTCESDDIHPVLTNSFPPSSHETSMLRWTSWPRKGEKQSIELKLKHPVSLESLSVYWYDDAGDVQVPEAWNVEYLQDGAWHEFPVYVTDEYRMLKDQYNMVHPGRDIMPEALRINITPRQDASAGILGIQLEVAKNAPAD